MYTSPARNWVEAMPLGNGTLGAMVFFDTDRERIALNHDRLWSGVPKDYAKKGRKGAKGSFERARRLALKGKYSEAETEIQDNFLDFTTEKYLPLGDIIIDFGHKKYGDYKRELDFESATASLEYTSRGRKFQRRCYASHPHNAVIYEIFGSKGSVSLEVSLTSRLSGRSYTENGTLIYDGECPGYAYTDFQSDDKFEYRNGRYTKGLSFRGALRVKTVSGTVEYTGDKIRISKADYACIYFTAETNFISPFVYPSLSQKDYKNMALAVLDKVCGEDIGAVYKKHIRDVSSLYNRVKLDLGTSGKDDIPTDERLKSFMETKDDLSLYTLLFDFARYLTIAASRKGTQAMNLQGIWNDKMPAPWRCNYTVNINTEMNYWPTLPSGLLECHEPLVSLIKSTIKNGREVARRYYGARGFVVHHNVDLWGHASAVYWMAMWGFWQGGSGWLCRHLFEQYEYTLDEKFLKNTAYPIIKEAALFYMDIMSEVEDGKIAVVPGTSPENNFRDENGRQVSVAKYTTMMNCIAYETVENAIKCCDILGIKDDFRAEAETVLSKIAPMKVGKDGRLLEWNEDFPETDIHHRHISHLYALHPADMITKKTPELFDAARKTLEKRGDDGTGWSLGWKINFYARLGDGNSALKLLERQLAFVPSDGDFSTAYGGFSSGTYANLFDAHPPFQIDGNFGLASGVYEMLARVIGDELYLLPALPEKWQDGSIEGMRVKGDNILNITWRDGRLVSYELSGRKPLKVFYNGEELTAEK